MGSGEFRPGIDDTQSFSVSEAVRAPVGADLSRLEVGDVRRAAGAMLLGLLLVILDFRLEGGLDLVPDTVGGLAIVVGAGTVAKLATVVGPARAGRNVWFLALAHLLLVVPGDLPDSVLVELMTERQLELVLALETTTALLGTAMTATVLARVHDALDQLGRRDRWAGVRRWSLLLGVLWLPLAVVGLGGAGEGGVLGFAAGAAGALAMALGIIVLVVLLRGLFASLNVASTLGHGER